MKLESTASLQIQKPIMMVFEGIVDPANMTQYFISESTARLDSGKAVIWKFPEFPERFPISEIKIEAPHLISFVWDPDTRVKIALEEYDDKNTVVKVYEGAKELNQKNLDWLIQNTAGWANFLASLKAYLEHGVRLREGAFDFMRTE